MSTTIVNNIPEDFTFVSDSQDVEPIKEHLGEIANDYDAFFVKIQDGDYEAVYGMVGIVPYLSKLVTRLI